MFLKKYLTLSFLFVFILGSSVLMSGCTAKRACVKSGSTASPECTRYQWGIIRDKRDAQNNAWKKESAKRLNKWSAMAQAGNAKAQYELGRVYESYESSFSSINREARWFYKDHPFSAFEGNKEYQKAYKKDYEDANNKTIYWFRKAAKQGHIKAQIQLANRYEVKKEFAKALHWYQQAAAQGNIFSKKKILELQRK